MEYSSLPPNIPFIRVTGRFDDEPQPMDIEQNDFGAMHIYIYKQDTNTEIHAEKQYTAKPIKGQAPLATPQEGAPSTSVWNKVLSWAGGAAVKWLEQPPDHDLQEVMQAVDQIRNPPEDVTQREITSSYANLVKSASSVTKLGMTLFGLSEVAGALGTLSSTIGGFSTVFSYLNPEPNFKNLKQETHHELNRFFNQRLSHIDETLKNAAEPSAKSRYEEIKELIENNQKESLDRAESAHSTEELVQLLKDVRDNSLEVQDQYNFTSDLQNITTLIDRASHTEKRTEKAYEKALLAADSALDQVEDGLNRLNKAQDAKKETKPSEVQVYKRIRIQLLSQRQDLTTLREQLVQESDDETARLNAADRLHNYIESSKFRATHDNLHNLLTTH